MTAAARAVGCANVVRVVDENTVVATNMDGDGFVDGLEREKGDGAVAGKRCLLVGAGGAARAIAHALLRRGAKRVAVCNRTRQRAERLAEAVPGVDVLDALPDNLAEAFDVLVQCTSLGHAAGDADPVPHDRLAPPLLCCEVIHTPAETKFLAAARKRGCDTHRGKFMLDAQIQAIARFLTTETDTWPSDWAYAPK